MVGALIISALTVSAAMAAPLEGSPFKGTPAYRVIDHILEKRIGMGIEEVKFHLEAHDLKETLEAQGIDVTAKQLEFRSILNEHLAEHDAELTVEHTETGVEVSLYTQEEKALGRGIILEARAKYLNAYILPEGVTAEAGSDDERLYFILNGATQEDVEAIQYRIPADVE